MTEQRRLVQTACGLGAQNAAVISVSGIPFRPEFRALCEMNSCGKYSRCWMCPPDVGPIEPMIEQAKGYEKALVFQTVGRLEDSFDIEGMESAAKRHNRVLLELAEKTAPVLDAPLVLGAGNCQVCDVCARVEDKPCRYPDKAVASLESYGIAVSELAPLCGMKYINGENTVTYFGAVLYGRALQTQP